MLKFFTGELVKKGLYIHYILWLGILYVQTSLKNLLFKIHWTAILWLIIVIHLALNGAFKNTPVGVLFKL